MSREQIIKHLKKARKYVSKAIDELESVGAFNVRRGLAHDHDRITMLMLEYMWKQREK